MAFLHWCRLIWKAEVCLFTHTRTHTLQQFFWWAMQTFCWSVSDLNRKCHIFCYDKHYSTLRLRTWYCGEMSGKTLKVDYLVNGLWKSTCVYAKEVKKKARPVGGGRRMTKGNRFRVEALTCGWVGSLLQMSWTLRSCFSPSYNAYSAFPLWCGCRSIRSGSQALRECSFHPAALSCDWTHLSSYSLWIPTELCCFYQG